MLSRLIQKLQLDRHRSAWLVGAVFALLIVLGLIWRSFYLQLLQDVDDEYQVNQQLFHKSWLIENLIVSARNRSVIIAQLLLNKEVLSDQASLAKQFTDEANKIILDRQEYFQIADAYETQVLNKHYELALLNRSKQDYLFELLMEGEHDLAIHEYITFTLPIQDQALDMLDALQRYVAQKREENKQRIKESHDRMSDLVNFSTFYYLFLLLLLAFFVVQRLISISRTQAELQQQLNDQLTETTVAYEQADKELVHLAHYDLVTDLMNRYYFEQCLRDSLLQSSRLSLLFVDLDNFKWFNDTLGHGVGDELLKRFAQRLCREDSPIAHLPMGRLGGDEFAIILAEADEAQESKVAQFLLASIAELDEYYGPAKTLNASIGIARYPDHAQVEDLLMRFADLAMYQAKAQGKGRAVVFNSRLLQALNDELDLEQALKQALQERQLQVFYQAQYRLSDLSLSGAEGLIRWQRLGHWVSPAVLIPMAEKTGHIHTVGLQMLEKILVDIQRWDAQGHFIPKVAVNVSPVQMRLDHSHDELVGRIDASGVDSTRIEVEITENAFADSEVCFSFIQHLAQRQIRIALDDFGTGYSCLSQITNLKIDKLKIDQSFVVQLGKNEQVGVLVKTIIAMGHSLGLTVLAEGIETQAQYQLLKEWGCDEGQGYLFARPVPADQFSFESPTLS